MVLVAAFAFVAAGLGATPSAGGQVDAPSVTLDRSLVGSNDTVGLTGNFTQDGDGVLVAQCRAGADLSNILRAGSSCASSALVPLDADLSAVATFEVAASFTTVIGDELVDCVVTECLLAMAVVTGESPLFNLVESATAPFEVGGDLRVTGPRPGELTVGGTVSVTAASAEFVWCAAGRVTDGGCRSLGATTIDANGTVSGEVMLTRGAPDGLGGLIDCRSNLCAVGVRLTGVTGRPDRIEYILTRVRFGDATVTLTPDRLAPGGGVVAVNGTGFFDNTWGLRAVQCSLPTEGDLLTGCAAGDAPIVEGPSGTYDGSLTVERFIEVRGETVDCAQTAACVVAVYGYTSPARTELSDYAIGWVSLASPVEFDVSPRSFLRNGQLVTIDASTALAPGGRWFAQMCGPLGPLSIEERCEAPTDLGPDVDGTIVADFAVSRPLVAPGATFDCGGGRCFLRVVYQPPAGSADAQGSRSLSIGFDRPPLLRPSTGLTDGQTVEINEVDDLTTEPGSGAFSLQCIVLPPTEGASLGLECGPVGTIVSDFVGDYSGTLDVARSIAGSECGVDGKCFVAVVVLRPDLSTVDVVGEVISFAPESIDAA